QRGDGRRTDTKEVDMFRKAWIFPPLNHSANAPFLLEAFRERLARVDWRDLVTIGLPRAKGAAARFFIANPQARAYVTPVWMPDDSVRLVRIGRRGGHRILWTFRRASWK